MKRTQGSTSEIGMFYQYAVTTLLAGNLSNNDAVEDYIIFSSDESAGKFDDIVAKVKLKESDDWYLWLIQVKFKLQNKLNVSDSVSKDKSVKYFISDYITNFIDIVSDVSVPCRQGICSDNIRCGIFCNETIKEPIYFHNECSFYLKFPVEFKRILKPLKAENNLRTIKDKPLKTQNVPILPFHEPFGSFLCDDLKESEFQTFLSRCFLWLKQSDNKEIVKNIEQICKIDDAKSIINYVNDYFNDTYLHKRGLSKLVFEIELQKIRLLNFIPPITTCLNFAHDEWISIWNKITLEHDITIVKTSRIDEISACLYTCVLQTVSSLLRLKINFSKAISSDQDLDNDTVEKFKIYSRSKSVRFWVHMPRTIRHLLFELWKLGDLPLIIRTNIDLDSFNKYAHLKQNYIVIGDIVEQSNIISARELKIFNCLNSIINTNLQCDILENTTLSLQGRQRMTFQDLLRGDKELLTIISPTDIIQLMQPRTAFLKEDHLNNSSNSIFIITPDTSDDIEMPTEFYEKDNNVQIYCHSSKIEECVKIVEMKHMYKDYTIYQVRKTSHQFELIRGDQNKLRSCFIDQYGDPLCISEDDTLCPVVGQTIFFERHNYICRVLRPAIISKLYFNSSELQVCLLSGDLGTMDEKISLTRMDIDADPTILNQKKCYFVKVENETRTVYWNKLHALGCPICDVNIKDGKMELLRYDHCKNLAGYMSYDGEKLSEDTFLEMIRNATNSRIFVITGEAGIGKSSLLKSLFNNSSIQDYILFYDLLDFQASLNKNSKRFLDPIEFIFKEFHKSMPMNYTSFLWTLCKKKRLILMLDSFDEIVSVCEKQVLQFIQLIANSGIRTIIATRSKGCQALIEKFNVQAVKLCSLENDGNNDYLIHWKISETTLKNIPSEFRANPLYLNLLKTISFNENEFVNITRLELYASVTNTKIKRWLKRNNKIYYNSELERIKSLLERLALVAMFGKTTIEHELKWRCDNTLFDYTKFGIISQFDEESEPKFQHYTFVEFFVAQWIAKAHREEMHKNLAKELYQRIINKGDLYILNILSEDLNLHRAILYADLSKVERIGKTGVDCWNAVDKLGRSALHMVAICCSSSDHQCGTYKILETIVKSMRNYRCCMNKRDSIAGWDWTNYVKCEVLEKMCIFECVASVEEFLTISRQNIKETGRNNSLFPVKYFDDVFKLAISFSSINIISDFLQLQNLKNKQFCKYLEACTQSVIKSKSPEKNFKVEGDLTALHIACIYGSVTMVQHLIKTLYFVDSLDRFTATPLYYSVMRGSLMSSSDTSNFSMKLRKHSIPQSCSESCSIRNNETLKIIKLLLSKGADLNYSAIRSSYTVTPLLLSVKTGNIAITKILLQNRANANAYAELGDMPLHVAVERGCLLTTQYLLANGAIPLLKNQRGETAIDIAMKGTSKKIRKLLCEGPINVNTSFTSYDSTTSVSKVSKSTGKELMIKEENKDVTTALHDAVVDGNSMLVECLLRKRSHVNVQNDIGLLPLHAAAAQGDLNIIKLLCRKGAKINMPDGHGHTALEYAILHKHTYVVQFFLERGADTTNCLHKAMCGEQVDIMDLLLAKGADINAKGVYKYAPLQYAAYADQVHVMRFLLQRGADANVQDDNGSTPLHYALAMSENINAVGILLENQADVNIRDRCDDTPLHTALKRKRAMVAQLLLENGADPHIAGCSNLTPLHLASWNLDIVNLLLDQKVNINPLSDLNNTPLAFAVIDGDMDIVKRLLLNGADVNIPNIYGTTPLAAAAREGHTDIVELLLAEGANINAICENNTTPLFYAIRRTHPDCVQLLLERGAFVNVQDRLGDTPLHYAAEYPDLNIVILLLANGAKANTRDNNGKSPSELVEDRESIIFSMLLQHEFNIDNNEETHEDRIN